MAYRNKIIRNVQLGQEIRFLQTAKDTDGTLLEMESTYHAASKEPPPHYHPHQEEDFTVVEGELHVRLEDHLVILKKGDHLHIPKNRVHSLWNGSEKRIVVNWKVQPAMNTEYFLETAVGISAHQKTGQSGRPSILQVALLANAYSSVFRLSKPSYGIQKIIFSILTPLAYLKGYRPVYEKYID